MGRSLKSVELAVGLAAVEEHAFTINPRREELQPLIHCDHDAIGILFAQHLRQGRDSVLTLPPVVSLRASVKALGPRFPKRRRSAAPTLPPSHTNTHSFRRW